ncbi:Sterile alpha motif type 2 [Penicillium capsulatum]|uniref:Sterile alpha motif type 2 n=1 Tax=Penicillium capsulatum TaxID=69766 RepID=A0A9W9HUH9_9EURO|nr:Sterile alpha motif type 2 [Penicillium capsulatum]
MEAQYAYDLSYRMVPRKEEPLPLFPPRTAIPRPASEATEIFEDEDTSGFLHDDSPMRSVASLGTGSISTISTPDDVTTPDSTGLTAFDFHIDDKNVRGPSGPHLFRSSVASDRKSAMDVGLFFQETPISAVGPFHNRASKLDPMWGRRDTPVPNHMTASTPEPQYVPTVERVSTYETTAASDWSPRDVVQWMRSLGFEDDIVQKFFHNDISGSILLELQAEDLKELDIMSFGKRHRVMSSIQGLRNSYAPSSTAPSSSRNSSLSGPRPSTQRTSSIDSASYQSCSTDVEEESFVAKPRRGRHHSSPDVSKSGDVGPGDSVSIVAIEQLLPKLHHCSKGEACRKWQKQQVKLALLAQDLPIETFGGRAIVAGDPGNPRTAPNLLKSPISEITPSLVASSDAMGPGKQASSLQLSQERLKEVKPRDPQENVRNFLNFQSLDKLKTANDPATPPRELLPSPGSESPDSAKVTPTLAENLRHLPRLQIPSMHGTEDSVFSENMSAQKTVTPSVLSKRNQLYSSDRTAIPRGQQPYMRGPVASPGDFYRNDPCYRQETPLSEADAPVTAVPIGPVAREESQSVPPNMRFGNNRFIKAEPVVRPSSTKGDSHRRCPSALGGASLNPLKEDRVLSPIETPEDLHKTPRALNTRGHHLFAARANGQDDVTHSGWMKKRKTTRLLRHEWEDHHFTLKGTQLAMHNDDDAAQRNSKALEYIDVDDYAVACSSLASSSKLTAAFKKTVLKRRESEPQQSAFGFSLIPAQNNNGGVVDRKAMFLNNGKSHHFAVKSRDERIDWMRELMLAKALKRGRETGASVNINGSNMI